jgi:hypothetical protein
MNTIKTMRLPGGARLKAGLLAPLALMCLSAAPHARADSILLAQATLVNGTSSTVDSFVAPSAGALTVSLKALRWPTETPLSALSFAVTSASQVLRSWSGTRANPSESETLSESETFDVAAGTYYAHIAATAAGALNLGLYSLMLTFSPSAPAVPLPSSDWMLLTGMFVLAGLARVARPFDLMPASAS